MANDEQAASAPCMNCGYDKSQHERGIWCEPSSISRYSYSPTPVTEVSEQITPVQRVAKVNAELLEALMVIRERWTVLYVPRGPEGQLAYEEDMRRMDDAIAKAEGQ